MMTVQKKQRVDITERFKQQLKKVSNSLQQNQPSSAESKPNIALLNQLTSASQLVDQLSSAPEGSASNAQTINALDRLMCDIVDDIDG